MLKYITSLDVQSLFAESAKTAETALDNSNNTLTPIIITPEQGAFETELSLYRTLGGKAAFIEMSSFTKLSESIRAKYAPAQLPSDAVIRTVSLHRALQDTHKHGNISAYETFIREMRMGGVTPDELREHLTVLPVKISDKAEVYSRYAAITKEYTDTDGAPSIAADITDNHPEIFEGRDVIFTGFDGFSGAQLKLITAIGKSSANLTFLFFGSRDEPLISRLKNTLTSKLNPQSSPVLQYIDTPREPEIIRVLADDDYACADFVCNEIRALITNQNYTLNDIGIIPLGSASVLSDSLSRYKISGYKDKPNPLSESPAVKFIRDFLYAVCEYSSGLTPKYYTEFLRSPFLRVKATESIKKLARFGGNGGNTKAIKRVKIPARPSNEYAALIERFHIKIHRLKKPFVSESKTGLYFFEPLRERIDSLLSGFRRQCKQADGAKITEILSRYIIEKFDLYSSLLGLASGNIGQFRIGFSTSENADARLLWNRLITVFESLHTMLDGVKLTLPEYADLFAASISRTTSAMPPDKLDGVTVGDLTRSRFPDIKVMFITGAVKDNFPDYTGLLPKSERERLSRVFPDLYETRDSVLLRADYAATRALYAATDRVYICSPRKAINGDKTKPPRIFGDNTDNRKTYTYTTKGLITYEPPLANTVTKLPILTPTPEHSPSALKKLDNCEYAYFLERVVRLNTFDENENIIRGNFFHALFSSADIGNKAYSPSDYARYVSDNIPYADERTAYIFGRYAKDYAVVKELRDNLFYRGGFNVRYPEYNLPPFQFGDIVSHGRVDAAIEVFTQSNEPRYIILDYKGKNESLNFANPSDTALQLLLYKSGLGQFTGMPIAGCIAYGYKRPTRHLEYPSGGVIRDIDRETFEYYSFKESKLSGYVSDGEIAKILGKLKAENPTKLTMTGKFPTTGYFSLKTAAMSDEEISARLNSRLTDVYNYNIHADGKNCAYCDYRVLCGRKLSSQEEYTETEGD
ncbi:MAG: PD-(D/E)XK nuclease family protein [Oscillospiraceae bacterium]|jgi:ATP-dependent helicase/DNAse subunit B|nr:PD-(D/E)XK nuclease family protein [Oscillospiraceae bacterium]